MQDSNSSIDISYSNIDYSLIKEVGTTTLTNNINADSLFIDSANGDYHLRPGSPCIDAANSNDPAPETDKDGNSRYDDPATPNTSAGANGDYYDMGAYEFPRNGDVNGDVGRLRLR